MGPHLAHWGISMAKSIRSSGLEGFSALSRTRPQFRGTVDSRAALRGIQVSGSANGRMAGGTAGPATGRPSQGRLCSTQVRSRRARPMPDGWPGGGVAGDARSLPELLQSGAVSCAHTACRTGVPAGRRCRPWPFMVAECTFRSAARRRTRLRHCRVRGLNPCTCDAKPSGRMRDCEQELERFAQGCRNAVPSAKPPSRQVTPRASTFFPTR